MFGTRAFQGRDDKILQRKLSVPFRVQRARARNDTKKRKNNQSLNDALFINRTLFAKATLLPSAAAAVKEEAAIVEDDVV